MPKRPETDYKSSYAEPSDLPPAHTPLSIILATMRQKYAAGDLDGAVALARIAAPYLHPRVSSTTLPTELAAMSDADLDAIQAPE